MKRNSWHSRPVHGKRASRTCKYLRNISGALNKQKKKKERNISDASSRSIRKDLLEESASSSPQKATSSVQLLSHIRLFVTP